MTENIMTKIKGPFTVTSSTQEAKTFDAGWSACIEGGQLVVGVEHSTYNGPYLEAKHVYASGAWAKVESADVAKVAIQ